MDQPRNEPFNLIAAILACLFPGAGHFYLGQRSRALYACAGIMILFLGGLFIGGIDVIDSKEDRMWYFGQACAGPMVYAVDWYHQHELKVHALDDYGRRILRTAYPWEGRDPATGNVTPKGTPPNSKSVTKMNELGTLSAFLAGMLNIIVVIDAAFPARRRPPTPNSPAPAPGTPASN